MTVKRAICRSPALGWAAVTVGSLILALVAAQSASSGPTGGRPAVRLMLSIPAPFDALIFGLFALAAFFVLWLLMPRHLRRRKKDDQGFEMVHESPKVSPWFTVGILALGAAPLVLLGYLLRRGWWPLEKGPLRASSVPGLSPPAALPAQGTFLPDASSPWFSGAVTVLAVAGGVGCLALALWLLFGDRLLGSWERLKPRTAEGLLEAIEESLDALRREADARRAIIRCYRRFEHGLILRGLRRDPWETPIEFMRRALGSLPLPAEVVKNLIDLFHLARFSNHLLGPRERDLAVDSLVAIRAALEEERANAPAV